MSDRVLDRGLVALRDAPWLTPERARGYALLFLALFAAAALGWAGASRGGLDPLGKPLGTDFMSFWTAARLALSGGPQQVYDVGVHAAAERAAFGGAEVGYAAFFYPPTFLLICLPLGLLPYLPALAAWLGATGYAYWRVVRAALGERAGLALPALAFPAVLINAGHGQNGFLTAALFGGGALMLKRWPILAGVCFGALAFKPHLGLLVPIALVAAGRWRTIAAAAATVVGFALASLAVFGAETWRGFLAVSPLARASLEQDLVGPEKMQSVFAALRLWHAPVPLAYAAQALAAVAAAAFVVQVARRAKSVEAVGPVLVAASLLASPFLLDYDLILLAIPLAWTFAQGRRTAFLPWEKTVLAAGFVLPLVSRLAAARLGLPLGPPVVLAVLLVAARRALEDGSAAAPAIDLRRTLVRAEPLLLVAAIAAWTVLLRWPNLSTLALDGDEALFLMIGKGWAAGQPPYAGIWDLKPPGLFLLYAGVSALFGDSLVGPKAASMAAVVLTSLGLYAFGRLHLGSRRTGWTAALLYPPYTLVLNGLASKPELWMAPFAVWGAVAAFSACKAEGASALRRAAAAGLLVGMAGMLKQTAIFEAVFLLVVLARADRGLRARVLAFAGACALPALAFAAWFASQGLFATLVREVVFSAAYRLEGDGARLVDGPQRLAAMMKSALPLVIAAGVLWAERRRWRPGEAPGARGFLAGWVAAEALGAVALRAMYPAYALPLLPPLALLAAALLSQSPWPVLGGRARAAAGAALVVAAAAFPILWFERTEDAHFARTRLPALVADHIRPRLKPGETIYVVDYEPAVYLLAGAEPPTRYALPMHLLCPFPAAKVDPAAEIARIMSTAPRCLVVVAERRRMMCEREALTRSAEAHGHGLYSQAARFSDGFERVDVLCRP